eukprot:TRINITY_DN2573_c0_g1_i1.p1 TRINITY_DN2573_c0_g1~~TRINITY_DN2573_c0_g1_i1.p1  ORF type:complete len:208 (+),score=-7.32 TRINITY_DN2573_c0_g1_i1:521-1144(+)
MCTFEIYTMKTANLFYVRIENFTMNVKFRRIKRRQNSIKIYKKNPQKQNKSLSIFFPFEKNYQDFCRQKRSVQIPDKIRTQKNYLCFRTKLLCVLSSIISKSYQNSQTYIQFHSIFFSFQRIKLPNQKKKKIRLTNYNEHKNQNKKNSKKQLILRYKISLQLYNKLLSSMLQDAQFSQRCKLLIIIIINLQQQQQLLPRIHQITITL